MNKKNMGTLILTSLIILLPAVFTKAVLSGVVLLIIHWICIFFTSKDKKNEEQNQKVFRMVLWIIPILSVYICCLNSMIKAGIETGIDLITFALIGFAFVIIGNYLPKCKQNYTIGIKVPWTYSSENNWNKTHRLCGKIWVVCGIILMFSALLPGNVSTVLVLGSFLAAVIVPVLYSYLLYRKEKEAGEAVIPTLRNGKMSKVSGVILIVILGFVAILMFTGNIDYTCTDDALEIKASYWEDMTVKYEDIKEVEYRENGVDDKRVGGFGSARLLMGNFKNDEFGLHLRYSYTSCDSAIVIYLEDTELVISGENVEATKELYEKLAEK